jgi:hypothetical protein
LELLCKEQQQETRMRLGLHTCFRIFSSLLSGK